jgi:methyl-accepting chemotaxis protein WspA
MFRLSNWTIRARLVALVILSSVGLIAVATMSGLVLRHIRVGGVVHEDIQLMRQILTEMEPSQLALWRPHLLVAGLSVTSDPAEVERELNEVAGMEREYRERYEFWTKAALNPDVRKAVEACHKPADDYFRLVREELGPALKASPSNPAEKSTQMERARRIYQEKVLPRYEQHSRLFDAAIAATKDAVAADLKYADDTATFWFRLATIVSVVAVVVIALLGWATVRSITDSTDQMIRRVREMASGAGDLTARVQTSSNDELAELAAGINALIAKIQTVVQRVREASVQLLSTASEIAATAKQQEGTVQGLSSATNQIAAAVREISATGEQLASTMGEVSGRAGQAAQLAGMGREGLGRMEATMKQLAESTTSISAKLGIIREKSEGINAVVTTIAKVADQTNLLSINAAIEAEKAGEYGRGFLVVAREIRRLADQTAVATLDIESLVRMMQDAVSAGVMQMDKFSGEFRSGVDRVGEINCQTGQIIREVEGLTASFQSTNEGVSSQSVAARQISDAMVPVSAGAKETQVSLQEFIKATAFLRQSVEMLNQEVAQFTV